MMKKILVPVDSIEWDNTLSGVENAIEYASGCKSEEEPEIILMHVLHSSKGVSEDFKDEKIELEKKRIESEFEEIKRICENRGLSQIRTVVREGDPEKERGVDEDVVEVAENEDVDLIVMGSGKLYDRSAKGRLKKFFYGSVTEKVLHEAPCSVLVARPTSEIFDWEESRS